MFEYHLELKKEIINLFDTDFMRVHLSSLPDEEFALFAFEIVKGSRASLWEKADLFKRLAEIDSAHFGFAADAYEYALEQMKLEDDARGAFGVRSIWRDPESPNPDLEEEYGVGCFASFAKAQEAMEQEYEYDCSGADEENESYFTESWHEVTKYAFDEGGNAHEAILYWCKPNGDPVFFDLKRVPCWMKDMKGVEIKVDSLGEEVLIWNGQRSPFWHELGNELRRLPLPLAVGDIVSFDCLPSIGKKIAVIDFALDNNFDCCSPDAITVSERGYVQNGALKHGSCCREHDIFFSPLYRLEKLDQNSLAIDANYKKISELLREDPSVFEKMEDTFGYPETLTLDACLLLLEGQIGSDKSNDLSDDERTLLSQLVRDGRTTNLESSNFYWAWSVWTYEMPNERGRYEDLKMQFAGPISRTFSEALTAAVTWYECGDDSEEEDVKYTITKCAFEKSADSHARNICCDFSKELVPIGVERIGFSCF